jgi:hypothetical protein
MKAQKRIAKLTVGENHAWEFAFCFYANDGKTDLQADKLAWRDLLLEFPRLRRYDSCH